MSRLETASRLVAALLATTCLTPIVVIAVSAPALADGGRGNGGSPGGADSIGGAGGIGASGTSGGGGGAGATGGNGGTGAGGSLGGNGGASPGANGQSVAGSGGGGGGAHGEVVSAPGAIGAATGGSGGSSTSGFGGGGAGGYGAAVTGSGAITNSGTVSGGGGGMGAGGGSGGIGIAFGASGSTLDNSGAIFGGNGGQGFFFSGGSGGVGVSGADLGITNSGTIDGGDGGEGIPAANGGAGISGSRLTITNSVGASISGGVGGLGNESHGGDGGAGINSSSSTVTNSGSIAGGAGGAFDGNGGAGITGSNLTITNTATGSITGGASSGGVGGAGINTSSTTVINSGSITGSGAANAITFTGGANVLELQAGSTITGNVVAAGATDTLRLGGTAGASFDVSQIGSAAQYRNFGQFEKTGTSTWTLTGTPGQTIPWTISQGALALGNAGSLGSGTLTFNGGTLQALAAFSLSNAIVLNGTGTFDSNGNDVTLAGTITGSGGLTKTGAGTLLLDGVSSYAGTTNVNQGRLAAGTGTFSASSTFAIAAAGTLDIRGTNQTIGGLTGTGTVTNDGGAAATLTIGANGASTSFDGILQDGTSTLGLSKTGAGRLNLAGVDTYTGPTSVLGGTLAVNGSITSDVTVAAAGTLGGSGTIFGTVTNNGTVAPGNSIGTVTVNGSYTQAPGSTYQVEINSAGQNDRLNVTGAPGTATLNGGTVQVIAAPGAYGRTTTYTILNATGGVSGTFAGVTSNFAFLRPSLDYDLDDVFLTLTLQGFTFGSLTPNQRAVGNALDRSFADASGDFAAVLGTIAGLDTVQGPKALNALSGEPYADFGTVMVGSTTMVMNALGQQMAAARGTSAAGTRQALAQACDADACDTAKPWGTWVSAVGGLGSVQGDGNASMLTYSYGGAVAGIDYRVDPRFLLGTAAGYTSGSLRVDSFGGQGWSDSVAIAAYGSFTQAALYVDALAGYAHFDNRLQRQIGLPGVQRTANGSTQANQAFGQIETGYKLRAPGIANTSVTPFARLQLSTTTQNGFSEWGANAIDLTVAAQTTTSARGVLGVDLAGSFDMGDTRSLDLDLRLGWSHEYADTSRPMTAAFAGAPTNPFTVYGAAPSRDAAVLGFQARTTVSEQAQLYLRYDGEISSESNAHTLNAGVRLVW